MQTEFSSVFVLRTLIVCGIIQVLINVLGMWMLPNVDIQSSWLLIGLSYLMMISYIIINSSYRLSELRRDFNQLKDREVLWSVLLTFMTQFFISSGGYQLVLSGLYYINEPLAIEIYESSGFSYQNNQEVIWLYVTIALLVPVFEEFLFRGVILSRLLRYFSMMSSLILMSICFGALHGVDFIGATAFAFLCGLLYLKYHNIWAPILVHIINNSLTTLSFIMGQELSHPIERLNEEIIFEFSKEGIVLIGVGIVLFLITIKSFKTKHHKWKD
ncbi:MAG: CPBP family intramembrane metalloprotease [Turicibacter sp.]|nr:CPBP family intramembrane metalloprotease [Turicibacter sp.]